MHSTVLCIARYYAYVAQCCASSDFTGSVTS